MRDKKFNMKLSNQSTYCQSDRNSQGQTIQGAKSKAGSDLVSFEGSSRGFVSQIRRHVINEAHMRVCHSIKGNKRHGGVLSSAASAPPLSPREQVISVGSCVPSQRSLARWKVITSCFCSSKRPLFH